MVELADASDSKSDGSDTVSVRPRSAAPPRRNATFFVGLRHSAKASLITSVPPFPKKILRLFLGTPLGRVLSRFELAQTDFFNACGSLSLPSLCKRGCRAKRGGRVVKFGLSTHNNPPSCLRQSTVSRGSARASVGKCPEQWGISKFASGKEPTGLFARKHLFTPCTGEANIWETSFILPKASCHTVAMRSMRGSAPYTGEAREEKGGRLLRKFCSDNERSTKLS